MTVRRLAARERAIDQERVALLLIVGACEAMLANHALLVSMCDHIFHPDLDHVGTELKFSEATRRILKMAMGIDDVVTDVAWALRSATQTKDAAILRLTELERGDEYPFVLEVIETV